MAEIRDEILNLLSKIWTYIALIALGLIGKFSYDIISGKKITFWQALASAGIAVFIGFMAGAICNYNGWEKQQTIIIPVSTLLSEKIILALFSLDYKGIAADIAKWFTRKLK